MKSCKACINEIVNGVTPVTVFSDVQKEIEIVTVRPQRLATSPFLTSYINTLYVCMYVTSYQSIVRCSPVSLHSTWPLHCVCVLCVFCCACVHCILCFRFFCISFAALNAK